MNDKYFQKKNQKITKLDACSNNDIPPSLSQSFVCELLNIHIRSPPIPLTKTCENVYTDWKCQIIALSIINVSTWRWNKQETNWMKTREVSKSRDECICKLWRNTISKCIHNANTFTYYCYSDIFWMFNWLKTSTISEKKLLMAKIRIIVTRIGLNCLRYVEEFHKLRVRERSKIRLIFFIIWQKVNFLTILLFIISTKLDIWSLYIQNSLWSALKLDLGPRKLRDRDHF